MFSSESVSPDRRDFSLTPGGKNTVLGTRGYFTKQDLSTLTETVKTH